MKRKNKTNSIKVNNHSNEIPRLVLTIQKASNDFITESLSFECSGWNMDECIYGFDFLLNRYAKLGKKKNEK